MIRLTRQRTAAAVTAAYRGTAKHTRDRELLLAQRQFLNDPLKPIEFRSSFWKNAKKQLKIEAAGKCAYCEANTDVVAHGDVEHYRPKSLYWWLAYTYDNYLFACQICNQVYKSDNFPFAGAAFTGPVVTAAMSDEQIELLMGNISPDPIQVTLNYRLDQYENAHRGEQALLLNPYFDDPTAFIAYEAEDSKQEVKIIAANDAAKPYIKSMEDYYGINRIELKTLRYEAYRLFRIFKLSIPLLPPGQIKDDTIKIVEDMQSSRSRFAGMNLFFNSIL